MEISSAKAPPELTRELCEGYDAVMCMTDAQADALAARWPELDEQIMCLGETDYVPPRLDTQRRLEPPGRPPGRRDKRACVGAHGPEDGDD